jgi:hypothetical protein
MTAVPWALAPDGIVLAVRLTPKAGRDAIDGVDVLADGRAVLAARVRALPAEGEANEALMRLIAKAAGVRLRDVTLVAGTTGRLKRLAIAGHGPTVIAALEKIAIPR